MYRASTGARRVSERGRIKGRVSCVVRPEQRAQNVERGHEDGLGLGGGGWVEVCATRPRDDEERPAERRRTTVSRAACGASSGVGCMVGCRVVRGRKTHHVSEARYHEESDMDGQPSTRSSPDSEAGDVEGGSVATAEEPGAAGGEPAPLKLVAATRPAASAG
jgi:hypothetical protein